MTRVVVTGATGNVGSAVVRALAEELAVDEIVGLARRRPDVDIDKVEWRIADVGRDELDRHFRGADVVIHLAWLIQPSRDETATWEANVVGTNRVLAAVEAEEVPAVIVASSVGAYSPGSKERRVDESWPTHGVATSSYSRQKAYVERLLDLFESRHADVRLVRMRPGLVFQRDAATEIRRLFAGPFLPTGLLAPKRLAVFPDIGGVIVQVVHADDLASAFRAAVVRPVRGPFNVAADPPLDMKAMADSLGARRVAVAPGLARAAASATWRLHLQPTDPGWLDLALAVPLMDCRRVQHELGWTAVHSPTDAFTELVEGMAAGDGAKTAPLQPDSLRSRFHELRTGVGRS